MTPTLAKMQKIFHSAQKWKPKIWSEVLVKILVKQNDNFLAMHRMHYVSINWLVKFTSNVETKNALLCSQLVIEI